jgi:hypothetical protein
MKNNDAKEVGSGKSFGDGYAMKAPSTANDAELMQGLQQGEEVIIAELENSAMFKMDFVKRRKFMDEIIDEFESPFEFSVRTWCAEHGMEDVTIPDPIALRDALVMEDLGDEEED